MGGEEVLGVTTGQPNLYKQDLSKLVSRDTYSFVCCPKDLTSFPRAINILNCPHGVYLLSFNSVHFDEIISPLISVGRILASSLRRAHACVCRLCVCVTLLI